MSSPSAKFIINPASGRGAIRRKWPRVMETLEDTGLRFDFEFTRGPQHGTELARDAARHGCELVVAVGGDGTVNEVVNGLLDREGRAGADLGILRAGTANDFASSLGLPRDMGLACQCLAGTQRVEVDIGAIECSLRGRTVRRFFVNVAGAGFDAALLQAARSRLKPFGARLPYVGALAKTIISFHSREFNLDSEGVTQTCRALAIMVTNGRFAGTMPFHPEADLSDGQFEVMPLTLGRMLRAVPPAMFKLRTSHPCAECTTSSCLTLHSTQRVPVEVDGEVLGELPARFYVLPRALKVAAQHEQVSV